MGRLTYSINVTLDGCIDHEEGIADDETHEFFTRMMDEYRFLVHPRIAGHGPTLHQDGLATTRQLDLIAAEPLRCGAVAMHYRRAETPAS